MSLIVLLASSLYLNFAVRTEICSDQNCNITPAKGEIIACECGVARCELDCSGDTNCQDIVFFSAATVTKVVCPKQDSCKQSSINIGDFEDLPDSLLDANFAPCLTTNSLTLECGGESSCKEVNVTASSISQVSITASAKDAFDESIVDCNGVAQCSLTCSNSVTSCDDAECNGECKCTGKMCPGWTKSPTPPPVEDVDPVEPAPLPVPSPTSRPTPAPVPAYVRCEKSDIDVNGVCELNNLKAFDQVVVTADDGVEKLVINCFASQQCKPIVVNSAANSTEINCCDRDSNTEQCCMDSEFNVGEQLEAPEGFEANEFVADGSFDSVALNCYGKQACKEANLTASGTFAGGIKVMALGEQSYQDSKTECDDSCTVECNENEPETCGDPICDGIKCKIINVPMRQSIKRISDVTTIVGEVGGTVVFDNEQQDCRVDCSGTDQCKEGKKKFQVFSGCNRTVIDCSGYAACKGAEIFVGDLVDNLPDGKTADDFSGIKQSLEIICGETGCEEAAIIIKGTILSITITAEEQASLKAADLICDSGCVINCGQKGSNQDSCKDLDVRCDSGCVCNGGSCVDIERSPESGTRINTPAPTSETSAPTLSPTTNPTAPTEEPTKDPTEGPTERPSESPTKRPTEGPSESPSRGPSETPTRRPSEPPTTPEPSESPTKRPTTSPTRSPTTSDLVRFEPNGESVVVCKNNVDICEIHCNNVQEQCSGTMKVLSGANYTRVFCNFEDACKGATIYVGSTITATILSDLGLNLSPSDFDNDATLVDVNCQAQTGCKEINIQVNQALTSGVTVLGGANSDTLEKATISVTGPATCSVDCGSDDSTPSCKELTLGGTCTCTGSNCPTQARISGITSIPNDGDIIGEKHYPTFLQMIMMGCIGFGLMCLISFFVYFKFFANNSINHKLLADDGINYNVYNTFSGSNSRALEMESYLK